MTYYLKPINELKLRKIYILITIVVLSFMWPISSILGVLLILYYVASVAAFLKPWLKDGGARYYTTFSINLTYYDSLNCLSCTLFAIALLINTATSTTFSPLNIPWEYNTGVFGLCLINWDFNNRLIKCGIVNVGKRNSHIIGPILSK